MAEEYLVGTAAAERHCALARYFGDQPLEIGDGAEPLPNLRKLSELPYQQAHGELWEELFATLTDFRFHERKAATGLTERTDARGNVSRTHSGVFQLQDDFDLALRRWSAEDGSPLRS